MSRTLAVRRTLLSLSAVAVFAGCGRDGTGPQRLTPEEVGGEYLICTLVFQPNQTLFPTVDVRAVATDTAPNRHPQLNVDNLSFAAELEYFPPGGTLRRRHAATYQGASRTILLSFAGSSQVQADLFLPATMELDFERNPNRLTFVRTDHGVARGRYSQLAGIDSVSLADTIRGTFSAGFQVGGCP